MSDSLCDPSSKTDKNRNLRLRMKSMSGRAHARFFEAAQRQLLGLLEEVEREGYWSGTDSPAGALSSFSFSLRVHVIAADGDFDFEEYEFLKQIYRDEDSYSDEKALIESHLEMNPNFLDSVPDFLWDVIDYDVDHDTRLGARSLGFIAAMCSTITQADGVSTDSEVVATAEYQELLRSALISGGVPYSFNIDRDILPSITGSMALYADPVHDEPGSDIGDWGGLNEGRWAGGADNRKDDAKSAYAVYDPAGKRMRGGFLSEVEALDWIQDHFEIRVESAESDSPKQFGGSRFGGAAGGELSLTQLTGGVELDGRATLAPLSAPAVRGEYMEVQLHRLLFGVEREHDEEWCLVEATWRNLWNYRLNTCSSALLIDSSGFQHSKTLLWPDREKFVSPTVRAALPRQIPLPQDNLEAGAATRGWIGFSGIEEPAVPQTLALTISVFAPGSTSGWVQDTEVIRFGFGGCEIERTF